MEIISHDVMYRFYMYVTQLNMCSIKFSKMNPLLLRTLRWVDVEETRVIIWRKGFLNQNVYGAETSAITKQSLGEFSICYTYKWDFCEIINKKVEKTSRNV